VLSAFIIFHRQNSYLEFDLSNPYVHFDRFDEGYLLVIFLLHFDSIFPLINANLCIFILKLARAKYECQQR
jgi:hypothetical protein